MQTHLCIADLLLFCCFCEPQHKLRDRKSVRLMKNLVTTFRQAIPAPQLCRTLKTLATLIMLSSNNALLE